MNDFLATFYDCILEDMSSLRNDPQYNCAVKAYMEIESEVKEKIGEELLDRYQQAEEQVFLIRNLEVLHRSLRFGASFALALLDS